MTLSNGVQVELIQREGFQELVCSGNPDRVLTEAEWSEAADRIASDNRRRLAEEKNARHQRSIKAFQKASS